jgi:GH35 family endo-1,4-beta-xylanase
LIDHSPKVFESLRKIVPKAQLGISDCAKFAPENASAKSKDLRQKDMYRGLTDIQWLKSQGVKPDFMGIHGHRPFGLWPEAKNMYDVFDTFAREDVRLHVTELSIPEGVPFLGNIRGGQVTSEQQAEFYTRFFTICYSHPSVDMVNIWGIGPDTWKEGGGLLNADYSPKPGFEALKKLITETWRTNASLRTGIDGIASFRGFQGDYEADVTLPSGKRTTVKFSVPNGAKQALVRLRVDGENVRVAAGSDG